jgi:23S rRNA pseudouridine1911/1915/1917 synthase
MVKIDEKNTGKRLDLFVMEKLHEGDYKYISRNFLTNNWEGIAKVDGVVRKQAYKLKTGEEVDIDMEKVQGLREKITSSIEIKPQEGDLEVLFESDDFLIIDKPKGVVVHPGIGNEDGTLVNYVKGYLSPKNNFKEEVQRAGIVHRLDKGVSGLIVFAKNLEMQKHLQEQFENHEVKKVYLANIEYKELRRGIKKYFPGEESECLDIDSEIEKLEESNFAFDKSWFKAEGYISRSPRNRVKMQFKKYFGRRGKKAISYIKPINKNQILVAIKTGRMHQIRATLEYFGIGIVGDTLYGFARAISMPDAIELRSIFLSFKELDGSDFTIIKTQ